MYIAKLPTLSQQQFYPNVWYQGLVVNSNLAVLYSDTNNISIENSEIMATSKNFSLYYFFSK